MPAITWTPFGNDRNGGYQNSGCFFTAPTYKEEALHWSKDAPGPTGGEDRTRGGWDQRKMVTKAPERIGMSLGFR